MQWHLPISIKSPARKITYQDKILLAGSCFTEHIGKGLSDLKFDVLQNPHGILFGVDAIIYQVENILFKTYFILMEFGIAGTIILFSRTLIPSELLKK
jgi:hypothetical protein